MLVDIPGDSTGTVRDAGSVRTRVVFSRGGCLSNLLPGLTDAGGSTPLVTTEIGGVLAKAGSESFDHDGFDVLIRRPRHFEPRASHPCTVSAYKSNSTDTRRRHCEIIERPTASVVCSRRGMAVASVLKRHRSCRHL